MGCEAPADDTPGTCPRCKRPAEWLPVDENRRGRVCRGCGWVGLPEIPVTRHTVGSLLRRWFPHWRGTSLVEYAEAWLQQRLRRGRGR